MSGVYPQWRTMTCCYAHEQCTLATEQWGRLLDTVTAVGSTNGCTFPKPSVDPSVVRLVNSHDGLSGSTLFDNCHKPYCNGVDSDELETPCRRGLTPWKSDDKCYAQGLNGLNEEIIDFCSYMQPLPEERHMREEVIVRVTDLITDLWPTAEVNVFGSYATDLYLPTSDIDLFVQYWEFDPQNPPDMIQKAIVALETRLIDKGQYDDVKVLRTSVPILKFTDRETAIKVDVGFNVRTGLQSVQFIMGRLEEYSQLRLLVLVLKQFLVYHNLLESFNGGISSYCLILLIISYLQLNGEDDDDTNCALHLIRFLELYGCQFNYLRTGIRVRDGGSYLCKNDGQYSVLYIEDPLNAANDVGRGCYGAMKVRDAFANAFRELRDAVLPQYEHIQARCSSFLGRVLLVPREIVAYRNRVRSRASLLGLGDGLPTPVCDTVSCPPQSAPLNGDDRSDTGSCSSQSSNLSSLTKSSMCPSTTGSQSSGSGAISDAESDGNSDIVKPSSRPPSHLSTTATILATKQLPVTTTVPTATVVIAAARSPDSVVCVSTSSAGASRVAVTPPPVAMVTTRVSTLPSPVTVAPHVFHNRQMRHAMHRLQHHVAITAGVTNVPTPRHSYSSSRPGGGSGERRPRRINNASRYGGDASGSNGYASGR